MNLYFNEVFELSESVIDAYGAFNVSLVVDLPLFVDPFLLFDSDEPELRALHDEMIRYLRYLRDIAPSIRGDAALKNLFCFKEVHQNWLGFSQGDNRGRGLGLEFARNLASSLGALFSSFGEESITKGSHLEKLCLIRGGVGRDMISDFTTNLIKGFLCEYTARFAKEQINPDFLSEFAVPRAVFNYDLGVWATRRYKLPKLWKDYVLLTPKKILTKDETWINKEDFVRDYDGIPVSIGNSELRSSVEAYLRSMLPRRPSRRETHDAIRKTALRYPQLFDYYIRQKEETGYIAKEMSLEKVSESLSLYVEQFRELVNRLRAETAFYSSPPNSLEAAREKLLFLKDMIENKGCHRIFYKDGKPIKREEDLQILYRLVWHETNFDVSREVNDGRGPADFKISKGAKDKTLVEMKLASNSGLARNLERQAEIYQKASDAENAIKVIMFFSDDELQHLQKTLRNLGLHTSKHVVLIDARADNKPSGSKA